jgi:hypothetical protein
MGRMGRILFGRGWRGGRPAGRPYRGNGEVRGVQARGQVGDGTARQEPRPTTALRMGKVKKSH